MFDELAVTTNVKAIFLQSALGIGYAYAQHGHQNLGFWASTSEGIVFASLFCQILRRFGLLSLLLVSSAACGPALADIGAYIVVDAKTGSVLDEKDATRKWYPASLTKMMTAYVAFKAVREGRATLTSAVTQSQNSLSEPPSKMGFKVGTQLTLDAALKIILIKSANDVAVAIGEAIAGSEAGFIAMMNAEARRLGMRDTVFVNPHGLPDNRQVSTARDMAILAMALREDFPEARSYYKHPGIKFGKKTLRSANREFLMRVPGADGMKTGYICNSGYNVAASATRRGRTIIVVVLGAASGLERIAFSRDALDKAFKKRSGRTTVTNLRGSGGNPPADRYCKRNPKPGAEGVMALYDMQDSKSPILSFSSAKKQGGILIPGLRTNTADAATPSKVESVKLPNGKIDWVKVMDRTIGPRRIAYAPITVRTGVPKGAKAPAAAGNVAAAPVALINVPLPNRHPGRAVTLPPAAEAAAGPSGAVAQTDFLKSGLATDEPAPGSLFRQGQNFAIPVPAPSPQR
ncbi:D-alanyl-D-alanine carboxypeptidase [Roseibium polysiphoniae]|uniref:D-alanyl-D-alanine carboxypeptidase n=1 Tax=Roseibium polysiphoniae TaxID=2571221 RepID=A0A944GTR8_9HYPH|nr:D-alanyl-D-alanine carboxypeptidase family protein [Roseibium polysiphoniae]MBS8261759.1 D-alanyl-D-alanine carboxypeptidase [Roseibium polysiphoniae]